MDEPANVEPEKQGPRWRRRDVLAVTGTALAAGIAIAWSRWPWGERPANVPALFSELAPGTPVQRWTVVAVHPVTLGAVPVVLATEDGRRFQVDVLARAPDGAPGVAQTEHLSLYVSNQGDGKTLTDEEQGLGVMALADALAARERAGVSAPELLTMAERNARHPDASFGVALR